MRGLCFFVLVSGCAASEASTSAPNTAPRRAVTTGGVASPVWADVTRSPWPSESGLSDRDALFAGACGDADGALTRVARAVAVRRARGDGAPDTDVVVAMLRAAGEPHVRPRLLFASGVSPLDPDAMRPKLANLVSPKGRTRCAVAVASTPHGGEVLVAVAVDALADLTDLPLRARTGEWLTFDARLHVDARSAKLVVQGPRGAPRTVPTSLDDHGRIRARFVLDRPGPFTVQLVGDLDVGPRPLLEARVFSDVEPSDPEAIDPAPGESAGEGRDTEEALYTMVADLRASEGLRPLRHDPDLEALARTHVTRMRDDRLVAHDVGEGDLQTRFETRALAARAIGENVVHATTVARAHRALYASPSHRANLLRADYTHIGIGLARADDGSVYACEVFAAR